MPSLHFQDTPKIALSLRDSGAGAALGFGASVTVTGSYEPLTDKPKIEGVTLRGDKTIEELGVNAMSVQDIERILYLN